MGGLEIRELPLALSRRGSADSSTPEPARNVEAGADTTSTPSEFQRELIFVIASSLKVSQGSYAECQYSEPHNLLPAPKTGIFSYPYKGTTTVTTSRFDHNGICSRFRSILAPWRTSMSLAWSDSENGQETASWSIAALRLLGNLTAGVVSGLAWVGLYYGAVWALRALGVRLSGIPQ
jgi:hypothetical protein